MIDKNDGQRQPRTHNYPQPKLLRGRAGHYQFFIWHYAGLLFFTRSILYRPAAISQAGSVSYKKG
jgi:hypothetical protein